MSGSACYSTPRLQPRTHLLERCLRGGNLAGRSFPVGVVLLVYAAVPVAADPGATPYSPPFIDHTEWVQWAGKSSLRIYPTASGRAAAGDVGTGSESDQAWSEVLRLTPDADSPGMWQQFRCHWQWAEFARPGKTSWNLEPWRPVVDDATMAEAGCNPGVTEEPF